MQGAGAALLGRAQGQLHACTLQVYQLLRRVRASSVQPDERDVQKALLECVGDRSLLPACFMTDQLVFQECVSAHDPY